MCAPIILWRGTRRLDVALYSVVWASDLNLIWGKERTDDGKAHQRAATMIRTRAAMPRMTISRSLSLSLPAAKS
jgi:hypothetical protein